MSANGAASRYENRNKDGRCSFEPGAMLTQFSCSLSRACPSTSTPMIPARTCSRSRSSTTRVNLSPTSRCVAARGSNVWRGRPAADRGALTHTLFVFSSLRSSAKRWTSTTSSLCATASSCRTRRCPRTTATRLSCSSTLSAPPLIDSTLYRQPLLCLLLHSLLSLVLSKTGYYFSLRLVSARLSL